MKKCVISLMLAFTMLSLPLTASAHPVPDLNRRGSITVEMLYDNEPVPGGSLNAYKVGFVHEDDGNYSFVPVSALQNWISEFKDIQSPRLAGTLAKYIAQNKLPPVTAKPVPISDKGTAVFSDLEVGLYLVVQETPGGIAPHYYKKTSPFLVSVPYLYNGDYVYDVKPNPKTELERKVKPPKPPTGGGGKLPQTGQLWWPVPVLVCAGLGFIVVGLLRRREAEDEP